MQTATKPNPVAGDSPRRASAIGAWRPIAPLILGFWTVYLALVFTTNTADALKAMGVLPTDFAFASGNFGLIEGTTGRYALPGALNVLLFAGVLAWEAVAAGLFWRALRQRTAETVDTAFIVTCGLWMAFIVMDELFITYASGGLEGAHIALAALTILTLLTVRAERTGA